MGTGGIGGGDLYHYKRAIISYNCALMDFSV